MSIDLCFVDFWFHRLSESGMVCELKDMIAEHPFGGKFFTLFTNNVCLHVRKITLKSSSEVNHFPKPFQSKLLVQNRLVIPQNAKIHIRTGNNSMSEALQTTFHSPKRIQERGGALHFALLFLFPAFLFPTRSR